MCSKMSGKRTMYLVTVLVLVSVVGANVNSTSEVIGSRMAWMKGLLDHHDWLELLAKKNIDLPKRCDEDLTTYLQALNGGQLWASKMYDASGQYNPNMLFGNEFWLGSMMECRDLQLAEYYEQIPPFAVGFHVIKINITVDGDHIPQGRTIFVGECLPASCEAAAVERLVRAAEAAAGARAAASGLAATLRTLSVRPVPGAYDLYADRKFQILASVVLLVLLLMVLASFYEGYLERKYRLLHEAADLELAHDDLNHKNLNNNAPGADGKSNGDNKDRDLRRETCGKSNETHGQPSERGMLAELVLSFSILTNGRTILSTQRPSDGALTCLHGIRFLSVLWVIMVHTYLTVFFIGDNKTMRVVTERNFAYQSVGNASYCVDTFFFIGSDSEFSVKRSAKKYFIDDESDVEEPKPKKRTKASQKQDVDQMFESETEAESRTINGLLVTVLFLRSEDRKNARRAEKKDKQDINKNINGFTNSALSISVISQQSFKEDLLDTKVKMYTKGEVLRMVKSFFVLFFYRVVRLTPAYAFVIGITEVSLRYIYNQSVFDPAIPDHITCDYYWWRNLLYINNLFTNKEMCMVWSWYMANDTQFYVVGIILLLLSVKHPKLASISLGMVLLSSWATTIYISVWHEYKARIQEPFEMFDALYDKPWSRIGPYLIGMMVGWYLHKTKCKVRIPYWLVAVGWVGSLAIVSSLIFGMVDGYFEVWPTAFYVSIGHSAWGVAVAWVTVACCCGYGGLVNSLLSYRGFLPLSRLTYCAYLVHPTIMVFTCFLLDGPFHLQNATVITIYAGYAVMAFLASFAISIAFEAPAVRLIRIISGGHKHKSQ